MLDIARPERHAAIDRRSRSVTVGARRARAGARDGPRRRPGDRRRRRRAGDRRPSLIVKMIVSKLVVVGLAARRRGGRVAAARRGQSTAPTSVRQTLAAGAADDTTCTFFGRDVTVRVAARLTSSASDGGAPSSGWVFGPEVAGARRSSTTGQSASTSPRWSLERAVVRRRPRCRASPRPGTAMRGRIPRRVLVEVGELVDHRRPFGPPGRAGALGGSRSHRSSPIIRRMNRSAASAGSPTPSCRGAAPAVVPATTSSHDSGVSYTATAARRARGADRPSASATLPP